MMRNPIILLSFLICTTIAAQQWAPLGATWSYEQGFVSGPQTQWAEISIVGDTMIEGRSCQILDNPIGEYQCFPFYPYIHYDGDSLWVYDQIAQQFSLLYCMNALPGDTWTTLITHSSGGNMDTIVWSVLDTSTVIVDGMPLRQIEIEAIDANMLWPYCYPHCTVIERIGNLKYMFDFMIGACDYETFHGLRCYEDDQIDWLHPDLTTCELIMDIPDQDDPEPISFRPNPVSAGEIVVIHTSAINGDRLLLIDAIGRAIGTIEVGAGQVAFSVAEPGVYFLRSIQQEHYFTGSLLVR